MRVFFFSTHSLWSHHRETELELMQTHLDAGDEVIQFKCDGELLICDANPEHSMVKCLECRDKRDCGKKLLEPPLVITENIITSGDLKEITRDFPFEFTSIGEFKTAYVENFDVGYAVSSSMISFLRESTPDILKYKNKFERYYHSSIATYYAVQKHLKKYNPDRVYIFNGRMAHVKPILRASQKQGVDCFVHERGSSFKKYHLLRNTTPHDRHYFLAQMDILWEKADPVKREQLGSEFFKQRLQGKDQAWYSYVKDQTNGQLPAGWDTNKRNIGIFNSSEDEFESIGPEWKNDLFESQIEGIKKIVSEFSSNPEFHFYLRIHPNLRDLDNSQTRAIKPLNYKNLTIIAADSPVSTYALLYNCEKAVTFGSTLGIEAVYWNKPSVLLGKTYYTDMGLTYNPKDPVEMIEMIKADLAPKDAFGSLKFGYYSSMVGIEFKYYNATGIFDGTFKNVDISTYIGPKTRRMQFLIRVYLKIKSLLGL